MALDQSVPVATVASARANTRRFDLVGKAFKADPFPTLSAMRAAGPVVRTRLPLIGRIWMTTTHASTLEMVKNNVRFVQEGRHAGTSGQGGVPWWLPALFKPLVTNMLLRDEPDHRRLRKLVDRAFQRRDIQAMRPRIEAIADRLIDRMAAAPQAELVEAFARQIPLEAICELLGLPEQDRAVFAHWTARSLSFTGALSIIRILGALRRLVAYVRSQIEACRRNPRPGLIHELLQAEADGERLDETELLSMVFLLLMAGFETTTHLIADSVVMLETHADQKAWLLADPDARMEQAVEELGRFISPVQGTKPRYVAADGDFHGQPMRRGEKIMGFIASANADPSVFEVPDRLRLDRFPNPHLVFSSGIHFCLGMQLARVETQAALGRLYARCPDLHLAQPDDIDWNSRLGIRGVKTLPVALGRVLSA